MGSKVNELRDADVRAFARLHGRADLGQLELVASTVLPQV